MIEDAAFQPALRERGEEALVCVDPRAQGRREVEGEGWMPTEPLHDLRVFVGAAIVEDDVDDLTGRDIRLDGVEEADELLVAVALHAAVDELAFEHVEGGEERRRAVAFVIVSHRAGATFLHRQAGLSSIERLDLAR